ncbi:uncharacterized protein PV09_07964 [Verruconis gallopava]|uniref:tRNA wybutosine-synthesizing protein 4 n=1 Tax=Verruconis gallopava TaxID=253628 RepID=A0A0D2A284_9PEZI|nr:uncharacterized protein PV09_07964 [Verruconis gallopava]KIW00435.1 hypothetical protein PV09_07964 [Verruconis gallopava]
MTKSEASLKGAPKAKAKQDEAIIGTNDYSIVSKRSVEKLYYKDEPEFYRAFVHKFKRRTPLINRGYWLRMRAIETVVKDFLDEKTDKSKAIVNLGCGYEPLAFRMLWKYPSQCHNVRFVDIDFPELIAKKIQIIEQEPVLNQRLGHQPTEDMSFPAIMFSSPQYYAVGCDLGDQKKLQNVFLNGLKLGHDAVLFIGEVSIVYMPHQESTKVIEICGNIADARFCLLENHIPAGADHPFARTMIDHFDKRTPLRGLSVYCNIKAQRERFLNAGWHEVQATDLWSLWQNDDFVNETERLSLQKFEPFDEYEGFALFAGHHLLLLATTADASFAASCWVQKITNMTISKCESSVNPMLINVKMTELPQNHGRANGIVISPNASTLIHCGGSTSNPRQGPYDIYVCSGSSSISLVRPPIDQSYSTCSSMSNGAFLLTGGRTSPIRPSEKCYLYQDGMWISVPALEPARYRHCAAAVTIADQPGVLVVGGRTVSGMVLDTWSLFLDNKWHTLHVSGCRPPGLFGATLATIGSDDGVLVGGLNENGKFATGQALGFWYWKLQATIAGLFEASVSFLEAKNEGDRLLTNLQRFGATSTQTSAGTLIIGGIGPLGPLQRNEELILLKPDWSVQSYQLNISPTHPLPMFIGHSVAKITDDEFIIVGGGVVCYSYGVYWNKELLKISFNSGDSEDHQWTLISGSSKDDLRITAPSNPPSGCQSDINKQRRHSQSSESTIPGIRGAQIDRLADKSTINKFLHRQRSLPIVLENLDLGLCTELWTAEYLKEKVGPEKPTIIHHSNSPHLSFREKNFRYVTVPFAEFMDEAKAGSHVYMRALSVSNPSRLPARLSVDYPELAKDFTLPGELGFVEEYQHSSVLRISGNVNMWLHYDVMSNVLCQIRGSKRILLFPPKDISLLEFPPGETTSNLDVFAVDGTRFANCSPMEATLSAGEVLFIPACWPHATTPSMQCEDGNFSVAVNIFFKSLDGNLYAAGRDVYGNRDLAMYENGRRDINKIIKLFGSEHSTDSETDKLLEFSEHLRNNQRASGQQVGVREINRILHSASSFPKEIANFYLSRLADELQMLCAGK